MLAILLWLLRLSLLLHTLSNCLEKIKFLGLNTIESDVINLLLVHLSSLSSH